MTEPFTTPSIVVGVDGSRAGLRAAQWAADEAAGRDLPLHLVTVSDAPDSNAPASGPTRQALTDAAEAVSGRGISVHTAVVTGSPTPALLDAGRAAVMICVGDVGVTQVGTAHADRTRVGSTAAALVASAHCPVAVVRGPHRPGGAVAVELDGTPDSAAVLQYAVEEARLRRAPLWVLGTWQTDVHTHDAAEAERMVRAQLDRRLEQWRHTYPDLDVTPVALPGSGLGWLAEHTASLQLVVVGARNTDGVAELLGPHHIDCTTLVIDPQRLL